MNLISSDPLQYRKINTGWEDTQFQIVDLLSGNRWAEDS